MTGHYQCDFFFMIGNLLRAKRTWFQLLLFFFFSFFFFLRRRRGKKAENGCSRRVGERQRGGVSGGRWSRDRGCFVGRFSVGSASWKKIPDFVMSQAMFCLTLQATSFSSSSLPNYDTNYRIFNVPTRSCAFIYSVKLNSCLNSCLLYRGGGPFFFFFSSFGRALWPPFYEILEATLWFCLLLLLLLLFLIL